MSTLLSLTYLIYQKGNSCYSFKFLLILLDLYVRTGYVKTCLNAGGFGGYKQSSRRRGEDHTQNVGGHSKFSLPYKHVHTAGNGTVGRSAQCLPAL